jgi:DNA replication protein DnaC
MEQNNTPPTPRYLNGESIAEAWERRKKTNSTTPITEEQKAKNREYWSAVYNSKAAEVVQADIPTTLQWFGFRWREIRNASTTPNKPFERHELHDVLTYYAASDKSVRGFETADGGKCLLTKGIAIIGDVGVGKSTLLKLLKQMPSGSLYKINNGYTHYIDATELAQKYQRDGVVVFDAIKRSPVLFIDDVGNEPTTFHMGNRYPIIGELLKYRAENNLVTHLTANKMPSELGYGEFVEDRLKAMLNFFWWGGDSKR